MIDATGWPAGFRVGHWTDIAAGTGCTVVIPPPGTIGAVDIRGGGASTRETELLAAHAPLSEITALLLSGGSAFGLDAAAGIVRWCLEQGIGYDVGVARVPIVPAAVVFDLGISATVAIRDLRMPTRHAARRWKVSHPAAALAREPARRWANCSARTDGARGASGRRR